MLRKLFPILLISFAVLFGVSCSHTPYEQARSTYEKSMKKYGDAFYRMPEFKQTIGLLQGIPSNSSEYDKTQVLLKKIEDERRESRTRNAKDMLEKIKARFDEEKKIDRDMKNAGKATPETSVSKDPLLPEKK